MHAHGISERMSGNGYLCETPLDARLYSADCMRSKFSKDDSAHEQHHEVILMRLILPAAHFAGRCRISASACNRFESTSFLVVRALSFSEGAKLRSFARSLGFRCELSAL